MENVHKKCVLWKEDYADLRPHSTLADRMPNEFIETFEKNPESRILTNT